MSVRIDPTLMHELKEYGAVEIEKCFNCGNCTAICPLASDEYPFPRNMIRLVQVGLKDRLVSNLDPWLCYYCGECSETCPKQAEPGETMMAMRRWLTSQYDWTGLSHKLYTSKAWIITGLGVATTLVILLAILLHGPMVTTEVELNTFAPVEMIHIADLILAGLLAFFLLSNVFRMFLFTFPRGNRINIPFSVFITEAWNLIYHALTQQRFSECEGRRRWINHLIIVSGYLSMFLLIVVFLSWFQTDNIYPIYHPQRWVGYLAAIALIYGAGEALWGRIRKTHQMHYYSHPSDWLFPALLILLAVSGLLIHTFRYLGLPLVTYYTYVAHLVIMMMLYICVGPMGKWAHLIYRPCAIYFQAVKEKAQQIQRETPAEVLASAGD
jgi:quinone-modifying oxidoreductase subunit QmoC